MVLSIYKTHGHSMEPEIKEGSFFLSSNLPYVYSRPKLGDNIIFKNKDKIIVKKIVEIKNKKYIIDGVNKLDSAIFIPISREEILGKVIWII